MICVYCRPRLDLFLRVYPDINLVDLLTSGLTWLGQAKANIARLAFLLDTMDCTSDNGVFGLQIAIVYNKGVYFNRVTPAVNMPAFAFWVLIAWAVANSHFCIFYFELVIKKIN